MNPITLVTDILPNTGSTFTTTVVVAGVGIVLAMLILLIIVFYAFGVIVSKSEKSAKARKMKKQDQKLADKKALSVSPTAAVVPSYAAEPKPQVQNGISDEIVAVIAAAVAASEGSSAVIRSIKKKNISGRNPWANAAVVNNTRPF